MVRFFQGISDAITGREKKPNPLLISPPQLRLLLDSLKVRNKNLHDLILKQAQQSTTNDNGEINIQLPPLGDKDYTDFITFEKVTEGNYRLDQSASAKLQNAISQGDITLDGFKGDPNNPQEVLAHFKSQVTPDTPLASELEGVGQLFESGSLTPNNSSIGAYVYRHTVDNIEGVQERNQLTFNQNFFGPEIDSGLVNEQLAGILKQVNEAYKFNEHPYQADIQVLNEEIENSKADYDRSQVQLAKGRTGDLAKSGRTFQEQLRQAVFGRDEALGQAGGRADATSFGARGGAASGGQQLDQAVAFDPSLGSQLSGIRDDLGRGVQSGLIGARNAYEGDRRTASRQFTNQEQTAQAGQFERNLGINTRFGQDQNANTLAFERQGAAFEDQKLGAEFDLLSANLSEVEQQIAVYERLQLTSGVTPTPANQAGYETLKGQRETIRADLATKYKDRAQGRPAGPDPDYGAAGLVDA